MAVETQINRPAPFIEDIGKDLATQVVASSGIPIVTGGIGSLSQMAGETAEGFKGRQDAARAFDVRKQNLAGLAPQVAGQDQLQQQAQTLATQGVGSFQPFLNQAQTQAQLASGLGTMALGQLGGIGTGAQSFQQGVQDFMSPYQSQVIDAEFGTGAARERALLQAGLLQQGFGQAQGARQQDIQNRFNLGQATQGLGAFQSGLGTQQAQLGAQQQQLQNVDIAQLGSLGAINQAQTQAGLDAQRETTRQAAYQPQEELDRYSGRVAGIMGGYPGQTVSTNVPNPTPLQSALGIGSTLAGLYLGRN